MCCSYIWIVREVVFCIEERIGIAAFLPAELFVVLQRIDAPEEGMATYAVQLGGADGRTLLMCVAPDWRKGMGDDTEPRASLWTVEVAWWRSRPARWVPRPRCCRFPRYQRGN